MRWFSNLSRKGLAGGLLRNGFRRRCFNGLLLLSGISKEFAKLDNLKVRGLAKVELHANLAALVILAEGFVSLNLEI